MLTPVTVIIFDLSSDLQRGVHVSISCVVLMNVTIWMEHIVHI